MGRRGQHSNCAKLLVGWTLTRPFGSHSFRLRASRLSGMPLWHFTLAAASGAQTGAASIRAMRISGP